MDISKMRGLALNGIQPGIARVVAIRAVAMRGDAARWQKRALANVIYSQHPRAYTYVFHAPAFMTRARFFTWMYGYIYAPHTATRNLEVTS